MLRSVPFLVLAALLAGCAPTMHDEAVVEVPPPAEVASAAPANPPELAPAPMPDVAGPTGIVAEESAPCVPEPATMTPRAIAPTDPPPTTTAIDIGTTGTVSLFVPEAYSFPADGAVELTIHFHGATWFAIQEHQRRGLSEPVVALELGQGSSVYAKPFEDPTRFPQLLDAVAAELKKKGAPQDTHIAAVNLTSFSAGYGAVREIVKRPEQVALVKRIVLGDSSYGSLQDAPLAEGRRAVAPEHVKPWADFARIAMTGKKTLLMTTSEITPGTYAGTYEIARAVVAELGLEVQQIAPGSCDAAAEGLEYPLRERADAGSFHWWGYGGNDTVVHMTLARHIADGWSALDACGEP